MMIGHDIAGPPSLCSREHHPRENWMCLQTLSKMQTVDG